MSRIQAITIEAADLDELERLIRDRNTVAGADRAVGRRRAAGGRDRDGERQEPADGPPMAPPFPGQGRAGAVEGRQPSAAPQAPDGLITDQRIRRGVFKSVDELESAIMDYLDQHIAQPKPFVWTESAGEILEKVARAKQPSESQHLMILRDGRLIR
jgi:hypothetical protein